jgi:hypothetical protein
MTGPDPPLRLIATRTATCWSPGCPAPARGRRGLCGPRELVYRATMRLYHALRARKPEASP